MKAGVGHSARLKQASGRQADFLFLPGDLYHGRVTKRPVHAFGVFSCLGTELVGSSIVI